VPAAQNASWQIPFKHPTPAFAFFEPATNPHVWLTFRKVQNPLRLPPKITLGHLKVATTRGVVDSLTSTCASRHSRMHFL